MGAPTAFGGLLPPCLIVRMRCYRGCKRLTRALSTSLETIHFQADEITLKSICQEIEDFRYNHSTASGWVSYELVSNKLSSSRSSPMDALPVPEVLMDHSPRWRSAPGVLPNYGSNHPRSFGVDRADGGRGLWYGVWIHHFISVAPPRGLKTDRCLLT